MRRFLTALLLITAVMATGSAMAQTAVSKAVWGKTTSGETVDAYTLSDAHITAKIITYGAHLISIETPDRNGVKEDVVLGFDNMAQYEKGKGTYIGAIVGRYGNRIARGTFKIGDSTYHVPLNNNGNALHGGTVGFDQKVWDAQALADGVELTLVSPDGDMGFPGTLTVHVRYTLDGDSLHIGYTATTTKPTVVNLTNHSYFNLAGNGRGTILNEVLKIDASLYTPINAGLIPTGALDPVAGTPFDFRKPTAIGERINEANEQLKLAGGYDHNYVLNKEIWRRDLRELRLAAHVVDPASGRTLTVKTTEPGVQFYSGNFLDGTLTGKYGAKYVKYAGFCLETQHFPDSPNHRNFPWTVLLPNETMHSTTVFTFGTQR
jgi:aldose 1-epimerase